MNRTLRILKLKKFKIVISVKIQEEYSKKVQEKNDLVWVVEIDKEDSIPEQVHKVVFGLARILIDQFSKWTF